MGGANALTTSLRPDLRTATIQSTNATDDTTTVRVCFSKAIASLPQAAFFHLGDYDDEPAGVQAISATRSTSNCADAVFPNADAKSFTFVTIAGSDGSAPDSGNSAVSTNGFGNIMDSTALIGSTTHNGTRGFGAGPDLVGVTINNGQATIDYTFDQRVRGLTAFGSTALAFQYNLPDGSIVNSLPGAENRALSADGLTVRVNFAPGPQIRDAVRAIVREGAVLAKAGDDGNELRSAARPGSGGFTDRPDLVAVLPAPDGSYVDYQFDQVLTAIPGALTDFAVSRSTTGDLVPSAVSILGGAGLGNTARAVMTPDGPTQNEAWVQGAVLEDAVTGAGGGNTAGGLPAGGNAGAFAAGFSVSPEALQVSFDAATDVAHVLFDQRWQGADLSRVRLIDDQGSQIAAAAINITGGGSPTAGRITAQMTFPPGTLAGARSLLLQNGAVQIDTGAFSTFDNQTQVISPTAAAATTARKFRRVPVLTRRAAKRR